MIPIFIKCSHRAFALDRLIRSLEINLTGGTEIVLLNDGIRDRYIDKLLAKFPSISQRKSANCRSSTDDNSARRRLDPSRFWLEEIKRERARYIFVLEEDTWLCARVDLQDIEKNIWATNMLALLMHFHEDGHGQHTSRKISARQRWACGLDVEYFSVSLNSTLDYYSLFMLAHGIYNKNYWVSAYDGIPSWVHERAILDNVLKFVLSLQDAGVKYELCKTKDRIIRQSGLTTGRKDSGGIGCDVRVDWDLYNETLNQAWLDGDFDSLEGFPLDYPIATIESVLKDRLGEEASSRWNQWRQWYVKMYESLPHHLAPPG